MKRVTFFSDKRHPSRDSPPAFNYDTKHPLVTYAKKVQCPKCQKVSLKKNIAAHLLTCKSKIPPADSTKEELKTSDSTHDLSKYIDANEIDTTGSAMNVQTTQISKDDIVPKQANSKEFTFGMCSQATLKSPFAANDNYDAEAQQQAQQMTMLSKQLQEQM